MPWAIFRHDNDIQIVTERSSHPFRHKFWKMMHIFNYNPYDIFTYGLRIDQHDEENIARDLCEILPYEVFKGDASLLRWILEQSIYKRVDDHVYPIGKIDQRNIKQLKDSGIYLHVDERETRMAHLAQWLSAWKAYPVFKYRIS